MSTRHEKLYKLPKYYDVAFSWDISREIEFFQELFTKYVPFEVKNILEPACGTGRFLVIRNLFLSSNNGEAIYLVRNNVVM